MPNWASKRIRNRADFTGRGMAKSELCHDEAVGAMSQAYDLQLQICGAFLADHGLKLSERRTA
jgi:hypothetical protein